MSTSCARTPAPGAVFLWQRAALVLAGLIAFSGISIADSPTAMPASAAEAEGLVRVDVKGVDQVYARKGADLSGYKKIVLDPIEVSFSRNWDPHPTGTPISAQEKQEIRQGLAHVLSDEFKTELGRSGRYQVVDAPAEDALRIKADIRDLYINAPDVFRPGRVRSYTVSTGEMTLVAELRDAASGDLIARVIDRRRDPESTWFELTTRVTNEAAAQRAASRWAGILREQLDAARQIGKNHP